jgi:hypothetical protein
MGHDNILVIPESACFAFLFASILFLHNVFLWPAILTQLKYPGSLLVVHQNCLYCIDNLHRVTRLLPKMQRDLL